MGLMQFKLARSTDVVGAAEEASKLVHMYASGELDITRVFVEAAKSSVSYAIVSQADTVPSSIDQSVLSFFRRTPPYVEHRQNLLHGVSSVNRADVKRVLQKYIVPLFEPATSRVVVVTGPTLADDICNGVKSRLGRQTCKVVDIDTYFGEVVDT
jgi:Zn-dependent M16 (insulinase) family peptidase